MFSRIGRRLAIFNAVVVFALIALIGIVAFIALRYNLTHELDRSLSERVETTEIPNEREAYDLAPAEQASNVIAESGESATDVITSGDTIVVLYNAEGAVMRNPRGVQMDQLPVNAGFNDAMSGSSDIRTVEFTGGEPVRVLSVPVVIDGDVVGVVQGVRSTRELEGQLEDLRWIIALGIVLAIVVSAPAGLYLASRAMQPINLAFDHQRQFVADVSHELRTPMTLIRANTEMALLDAPPEAQNIEPELNSVLHEIDNVDRLIGDLMLVAQLDSGMLELERQPQDLTETVVSATEEMRPIFDEHGIQLDWLASESLPAMIDQGRIAQVVRILLDNARKHTDPGGHVRVKVVRNDGTVVISVSDTGSGIEPEQLERVFDRFYRVDPARSRQTGGSGLGLPIARAIAEAHDGTISLASQPGQGTTARVTLPIST